MATELFDILSSMTSDAELTIWYADTELCDVVVTRDDSNWLYDQTCVSSIGKPLRYEFNPDIYE